MRIESGLFASREGLNAESQAISVIADNVSNAATVGYKTSRVEFADLFANGGQSDLQGNLATLGGGATVSHVRQIHETGVLEATSRPLDVGIAGDGFFMVGDVDNPYYTRAGNFQINSDGLLSTSDGKTVLGLQGTGTTLGTLDVKNISTTGSATSKASLFGNLQSTSAIVTAPTNPQTFSEINSVASFVAPLSVNDSLGASHNITVALFKTGINTWTAQAYIDGGDVGGTAGVPTKIGADATLTFSAQGVIADANKAAAKLTATPAYSGGASAGNFTIDLSNFTQFASSGELLGVSQDGKGAGDVKSFQFLADGTLVANLSTGSTAQIGKIQLAQFANTDGLERAGNTLFRAGANVGKVTTSDPGAKGAGRLEGSALENSTVDLANQFIELLVHQRAYQGNSQTLNATSQLLQQTIQLIR